MINSVWECRILLKAIDILAGICADSTRIRPDDAQGDTRQEQWRNWAVAKAIEELRRERDHDTK